MALSVALVLDGAAPKSRTLTAGQLRTMTAGGAEELYRGEATPLPHTVALSVTVGGTLTTATYAVTTPPRQVTYVEFALRGGRLVPASWTSAAITP